MKTLRLLLILSTILSLLYSPLVYSKSWNTEVSAVWVRNDVRKIGNIIVHTPVVIPKALARYCKIKHTEKRQQLTERQLNCWAAFPLSDRSNRYKAFFTSVLKKSSIDNLPLLREKNGYLMFRTVEFKDLIAQLNLIDFRQATKGSLIAQEHRSFAVNIPKFKMIVENRDQVKETNKTQKEIFNILMMHEILGALGYYDKNYEISLGLWMLSKGYLKQTTFLPFIYKTLEKYYKKHALLRKYSQRMLASQSDENGVSVVGSGGDGFDLLTKYYLIRYAIKEAGISKNMKKHMLLTILRARAYSMDKSTCQKIGKCTQKPLQIHKAVSLIKKANKLFSKINKDDLEELNLQYEFICRPRVTRVQSDKYSKILGTHNSQLFDIHEYSPKKCHKFETSEEGDFIINEKAGFIFNASIGKRP